MKFEVGQTVKLINNSGMVASLGATAVIMKAESYCGELELVCVKWEKKFNRQMNGGYLASSFEPLIKKNQQLLFSFMSKAT